MTLRALPSLQPQPTLRLLPGLLQLAGGGLLRMWRLLAVIWVGLVGMVVLVSAGPLFSRVAITADLQTLATNAPDGAYLTVQASDPDLMQMRAIQGHVDALLQLGPLNDDVLAEPQVIVRTPPFRVSASSKSAPAELILDGYEKASVAQHAVVVQGRLPQPTADGTIEIALARDAATALGAQVGSTLLGSLADPVAGGTRTWRFRVVGLVVPRLAPDPYWLTCPACSNAGIQFANPFSSLVDASQSTITALAAADALLTRQPDLATFGLQQSDILTVFWRYPVTFTDVGAADALALGQQVAGIDADLGSWRGPDGIQATMTGTLDGLLRHYWGLLVQLEVALTALEGVLVLLALALVRLMAQTLAERQLPLLATLRSRGATRRHVVGLFAAQGGFVLLAAAVLGPLLAVGAVALLAHLLLPPAASRALAGVTNAPMQAARSIYLYAFVVLVGGVVVLSEAIVRTASLNMLRLRQQAARSRHITARPRLAFEVLGAVLALGIYVMYVVAWTDMATAQVPANQRYVVLTNLGLLVTPLPYVAALLAFVRVLPWLLRLATTLAARRRGATALLACAQLERAGRPALRLMVVLALAVSVGGFFATLLATLQQHAEDTATFYAEAADLSGPLPSSLAGQPFDVLQARLQGWSGVQSATLGFQGVIQLDPSNPPEMPAFGQGTLTLDAVDADTYAATVRWSATYSPQPLSQLMRGLVAHQSEGISRNVVYAFADEAACERYALSTGATVRLPANDASTIFISYTILGCLHLIPGVYDAASVLWTGVGLLADYRTFAAVSAHALGVSIASVVPNYLWMRTSGSASLEASLRTAFPDLRDRRAVAAQIEEDPFSLDVVGVLWIGLGVVVLLAVFGVLLTTWLTGANRRLASAIVSALGMTRRERMRMVLYEQAIIYTLAGALGGMLWLLLLPFVAPTVAFLTIGKGHEWDNNFNIPPVQIVIPVWDLVLLLAVLASIAGAAVLVQIWRVRRAPTMWALRLAGD